MVISTYRNIPLDCVNKLLKKQNIYLANTQNVFTINVEEV